MSNSFTFQANLWTGSPIFKFFGGPYATKPANSFGVCLLESPPVREPFVEAWLPIPDFGVPADLAEVERVLKKAFTAALDGKVVFVGCMGGRGRTGLFLALLAKVANGSLIRAHGLEIDPVLLVRARYSAHAVETSEQYEFVERFDASHLRAWLTWELFKRWFTKTFPWL